MKFKNQELELCLEISDELINRIQKAGLAHYPNEFGGVLVGNYSEDKQTASVIDIILPQDYNSSGVSFNRGVEGLEAKLLDFYNANPSRIYLGEWHTHPNASPTPSWTDVKAIQEIVASETVNIDNPIMLILGLNLIETKMAFYVYSNNKLYKYERI